jgi:heterodisulfide reductase subunit D
MAPSQRYSQWGNEMVKMPDISRELQACLQCGYCVKVCPAYSQTPWESVTPRGKVYYLNQLANRSPMDKWLGRKVEVDEEFVDAVFQCTGCARCHTVCHVGIEFAEFWEKVREWIVDQGVGPKPVHKKIDERIGKVKNPYGEPMEKRDAWWPSDVPRAENPDVIFFAGCTASYREQQIAIASVRVLHRAGVKVNVLGEAEYCCTSPALRTGQTGNAMECAESIINTTEKMGEEAQVHQVAGRQGHLSRPLPLGTPWGGLRATPGDTQEDGGGVRRDAPQQDGLEVLRRWWRL